MPVEPTEAEVIGEAIKSFLLGVHTAVPGVVLDYDSAKQTANIRIAIKRAIPLQEGGWEHKEYPILPNVKVAFLGAGCCSLQFPVNPGDEVFLIFSESCWSQFRRTGEISEAGDMRRHDLSFPIAITLKLVGALRNVTSGPHFEIGPGKSLTIGEDPSAMDFVALSQKVLTEFNRVKSELSTLKNAISTALGSLDSAAGAASQVPFQTSTAAIPGNPGSVACDKLKTY